MRAARVPRRGRGAAPLLLLAALAGVAPALADEVLRIGPAQVGVVVNLADPDSVWLGEQYRARRGIPAANLLAVRFEPGAPVMSRARFERVRAELEAAVPQDVQVLALTWTAPYRVECMSVTTAFAAGFDPAFCARGCRPTRLSPYFNSNTRLPRDAFGWRPAMIIGAADLDGALALIDRGVAADGTRPPGTGYLLRTRDRSRSVRARLYDAIVAELGRFVRLERIEADFIADRDDVLFYFTGTRFVPALDTLRFRPGALADHLTSSGGRLTDSTQMSALAWIEAGATGTYGTVVEPCNMLGKFPHPGIVIARYLAGETLIEAYWKSVAMPGQGVFVGEPLAAPYAVPAR